MKYRYTNKEYGIRTVFFADGTSQFLSRGESIISGKRTKRVESGISVKNIPSQTKQEIVSTQNNEDNLQENE